jgi:hypothetical protein
MSGGACFVVQEAIHADWLSRHSTREDAIATIEEMIRGGSAEPGQFNIREIDDAGATVQLFGVSRHTTDSRE